LATPVQQWVWAARTALAERNVGYNAASVALAEVWAHCVDNAQTPWEAFGSPTAWADMVAVPPATFDTHARTMRVDA
jgi:hypothetical protein